MSVQQMTFWVVGCEDMTGGWRKTMQMDEKWMNSEHWWRRCASGKVKVKLSLCTPWMHINHDSWFVQTVALLPYGLGGLPYVLWQNLFHYHISHSM